MLVSLNSKKYLCARNVIVLLIITAFGPYVIPQAGIRLEHLFIYTIFIYTFLVFMCRRTGLSLNRYSVMIIGLFCVTIIWIFVIALFHDYSGQLYGYVATFENFFQPVALLFILSYLTKGLDSHSKHSLLQVTVNAIIALLCINALLAAVTLFFDTWPILNYFVVSDTEFGGRGSVMERAASMGRFSGIFNQPFESGLAYSIGLLGWVCMASMIDKINVIRWIGLTLLLVGGMLSVSKVFLMGGFPLAIMLWCWISIGSLSVRKSTIAGGAVWIVTGLSAIVALAMQWQGLNYFLRFSDSNAVLERGIIWTITAGRFGAEDTGVKARFNEVWLESPIFGFGAQRINATDNAYIEFFYFGGSVGLLFYILILLIIVYSGLLVYRYHTIFGKFFFALWILIIGAGVGAPVLTLNRASILLWLLIAIAFGMTTHKGSFREVRG